MLKVALVLGSLVVGDNLTIPSIFTTQGKSTVTLKGPDFCQNSNCLSDAGGSTGGLTNPIKGTMVADAGVFDMLCLVDGGCIIDFPGQVITAVDGGNLANLGLSMHCVTGWGVHAGGGIGLYSVVNPRPFVTNWDFCGCSGSTGFGTSGCSAQANDGGQINLMNSTGTQIDNYFCCGL